MRKWLYKRTVKRPYSSFRKHLSGLVPFSPAEVRLADRNTDMPDYIVWGVIDWHFRYQRPQHLSKMIAETGRRVFYISSNFRDDKRAGFKLESLDDVGRLFQVKLYVQTPPNIYFTSPSNKAVEQLRASIGELLLWVNSRQVISFVQHSFWYDIARVIPNSRMIYDCIDHHEGFGNNSQDILALEQKLLKYSDFVVSTSDWLDQMVSKYTDQHMIIRNATEFEHFAEIPKEIYHDPLGRLIIGYYGAIADWFDIDLIRDVAIHYSDCCVLLVGADTVGAKKQLSNLNNVIFIGEVAYSQLPYYLHSFDVALLPFKVIPLTLATNPVKVYEYLSAAKPVVAVNLPEMVEFEGLVRVADSQEDFLLAIDIVLKTQVTEQELVKRRTFASQQTWRHRAHTLIRVAEEYQEAPFISVIVVTYNNIEFTRACLESIDLYSDYENLEIIIIDNASSDGTQKYLEEWSVLGANRSLILNDTNRGFSAANNQGLAIAKGEYLVLLNNDTYVTPGWIRTLYRHFRCDSEIGLIGPVTNNIGNEAKIDIQYSNMDQMIQISKAYTYKHVGQLFPLRTAAFFCVMMSRVVYERIGVLDEEFGLGFFEDDDYCRRIEQAGFQIKCAEDVFIHHHLSASFMRLDRDARRKLFDKNKKFYEQKWGKWNKHSKRK
jgi:GT2 family glycosyltransferase/glycosyltransferase involved in cell wall biosynthesis